MIQDKYNKDTLHDIVYDAIGFDANNYQLEVLFSMLPNSIVVSMGLWGVKSPRTREGISMFVEEHKELITGISAVPQPQEGDMEVYLTFDEWQYIERGVIKGSKSRKRNANGECVFEFHQTMLIKSRIKPIDFSMNNEIYGNNAQD